MIAARLIEKLREAGSGEWGLLLGRNVALAIRKNATGRQRVAAYNNAAQVERSPPLRKNATGR
jgi:hypothetical protein